MKTNLRITLLSLAGLALISPAQAGTPVKRMIVRDIRGQARVAYVRASDNRILYPRVIQQIARAGARVEYRPALSSAYRPTYYPGYAGSQGYGYFSLPGRRFYPVSNGYPSYYRPPGGNYGVDSILYQGNRGYYGIPGYGLHGGAFPRPVVRPILPGLPPAIFSGNVNNH